MRGQDATALHQLPRGLPELQLVQAGRGRHGVHRGHERRELLHHGVGIHLQDIRMKKMIMVLRKY